MDYKIIHHSGGASSQSVSSKPRKTVVNRESPREQNQGQKDHGSCMQGAEPEAGFTMVGLDKCSAALTSVHCPSCHFPNGWYLSCLIFGFSVILLLFLHCTSDVVFLSVAHLAPRRTSTPGRGQSLQALRDGGPRHLNETVGVPGGKVSVFC